jgi:HNH endonuclease
MNRQPKSIANFRQLFMQRTLDGYHNMAKRAKPRPLPFTLGEFRDFVTLKVCGPEPAKCEYCSKVLTIADVVWDHRTPLSRSGSLHLDNLAICCRTDNQTKSELTADEYNFLMRGIRSMAESAQRDILRRLRSTSALVVQRMLLDKTKRKAPPKGDEQHGKGNDTERTGLFCETPDVSRSW